ncbi:MAG: hypothetical protein K1X89_25930 [Myxococcaceae bacterium]|nr:hypothetical protein [Myxococcaceae bacterium]
MNAKVTVLMGMVALAGCGPSTLDADDAEVDGADELVTGESELGRCFCSQPFTCGFSRSPSRMFSGAHAAMLRAHVSDASLIQTFGDAPASVGTHCPEPGVTFSAATDITPGPSPCARVHALRMQGFAAWYRVPPSFGFHIHAVYAGSPVLKSSLQSQLRSFLASRNGLVSNAIETHCPITAEERRAVQRVRDGKSPGGGGTTPGSGGCQPGGYYCGGDKLTGNASSLYRCNADGKTGSLVRSCAHGCSVNSGRDDSCRCVAGSDYCGGDVVNGNASTLYRCGADRVSTTVVRSCANGCRVNPGAEDTCR